MKIAVIGSSGFLGSAFCRYFRSAGVEVWGYDCIQPRVSGDCLFQKTDIASGRISFPEGIGSVFYFAQSPHYRDFPERATDLFAVNTLGAIGAASAAQRAGVQSFFYASSGNVYAPSFSFLKENDPLNRTDPYGLSKIMAEEALALYRSSMSVTAVRFFGLYGPEQRSMLPHRIKHAILDGKEIFIEKNPENSEDREGMRISFLFVEDAVRILEILAEKKRKGILLPPALNVAGPDPVSIRQFAREAAKHLKKESKCVMVETNRKQDLAADISVLKSILGLSFSFTPFEEAMARTFKTQEFAAPAGGFQKQ